MMNVASRSITSAMHPLRCYHRTGSSNTVTWATRLFWPKWAAANETLSGILLAASILVFVVAWGLRFAAKRRREKEWLDHVLATAPVLDYGQIAFHGATD